MSFSITEEFKGTNQQLQLFFAGLSANDTLDKFEGTINFPDIDTEVTRTVTVYAMVSLAHVYIQLQLLMQLAWIPGTGGQ